MVIKSEIKKILRNRIILLPMILVIGLVVYSQIVNGEFGQDYNESNIVVSEINGNLAVGAEGYLNNKKVAKKYTGEVTNAFLENMHKDILDSSYAVMNDSEIYNATYRYFKTVFQLGEEHYFNKEQIFSDKAGTVKYGFTGDWDAYGNIVKNFFRAFTLFIIIFASQIFTYEKECDMEAVLGTVKHGGERLFRYKAYAAFIVMNIFLFLVLVLFSGIHFGQYGFENADVSIQCSSNLSMVNADMNCTMGQMMLFKILFGILGENLILLITLLISMMNENSLVSIFIALFSIWILNYDFIKWFIWHPFVNIILTFFPINMLDVEPVMRVLPGKLELSILFVLGIALMLILIWVMKRVWKKGKFYQ